MEVYLQKADAIAAKIAETGVAERYWQARMKMQNNAKAQELFEELKLKTNSSLILRERLSPEHPKVLLAEVEVHEVEQKLAEIPVAMQYKEAQAELNDLMQGVVGVLLSRLSGDIPVELGPRQGCGQGHGGNGCNCGKDD